MAEEAAYQAMEYGLCPSWALSLGYMGVAAGAVLSNWGSAVSSDQQPPDVKKKRCSGRESLDDDVDCYSRPSD
jgi:hypothetical protein